jgi:transposase-like protein
MARRKSYTAAFKAKVALEALRGDRTANELAAAHQIHPTLVSNWKMALLKGADGPLHADFHALRHSYLTALGRGGVDLRTAQELAGHSTPTLTAR